MKYDKDSIDSSVATLRKLLPEGSKVYAMVTKYQPSGTRHVRVFCIADGELYEITGYAAIACGFSRSRGNHWDIVLNGGGYEAEFEVVSAVSRKIHPDAAKPGYSLERVKL